MMLKPKSCLFVYYVGSFLLDLSPTRLLRSAHSLTLNSGRTVGKYGPKYDENFLVNNPGPARKWMNKCYGTSYWSQLKTVHRHLLTWQQISGVQIFYPFSYEVTSGIILYMIENLKLAANTLYSYVSTIKALHIYQGFDISGIEDKRIKLLLRGYKNILNSAGAPVNTRKVMTFETMQLFGHELCDTSFDYETKQAIWTLVVVSFWGSIRYGDFMPGSQGIVHEKLLTWDRIQMTSDDHGALFLHDPKEDRDGKGVAKDLVRYKDHVYCPLYNLEHLYRTRVERREVEGHEPIFLTSKDKLINMAYMRRCLSILDKYFGGYGKITCHSARAGLPSHVAGMPELFTQKEIMDLGNWATQDSADRYCRTQSLGKIRILRKVASTYR